MPSRVRVGVNWNRLFPVLLGGAAALVLFVWLATRGPGRVPATAPGEATARSLAPLPPLIFRYAAPLWDLRADTPTRAVSIRVTVLDGPSPEAVTTRPAATGREWLVIPVRGSYRGPVTSAGPLLDFSDARLIPAGAPAEKVVSARPVGQAFFKVYDHRPFPAIRFDPGETTAELELLFAVPLGSGPFLFRQAREGERDVERRPAR